MEGLFCFSLNNYGSGFGFFATNWIVGAMPRIDLSWASLNSSSKKSSKKPSSQSVAESFSPGSFVRACSHP